MKITVTCRGAVSALALLAVLAAMTVCSTASASAAAPAWPGDARYGATPTLTNDVGQPAGGAGAALPVGVVLLAAGLLGLGACVPFTLRLRRGAPRIA